METILRMDTTHGGWEYARTVPRTAGWSVEFLFDRTLVMFAACAMSYGDSLKEHKGHGSQGRNGKLWHASGSARQTS